MSIRVSKMDPEFGYGVRVTGTSEDDEALEAASAVWPALYPDADGGAPTLAIESKGWYRCQPCVCGMEHPYDIWPTEPNVRGASFTYLIGERVPA